MATIEGLSRFIGRATDLVKRYHQNIADDEIGPKALAWSSESTTRALEISFDDSLTEEEKTARIKASDAEIDAQKTPQEREAEKRYWQRMGADGAVEELLRQLSMAEEAEV